MLNNYNEISANEIEIIKNNATKPVSTNKKFHYSELDDRVFETLLYNIFKDKIENDETSKFDRIALMQGVGEKGMDCFLSRKGEIHGIIQCKRLKRNVNLNDLYSEIIKFVLHSLYDTDLINNPNEFTYYFASSNGYSGEVIRAANNIAQKIQSEEPYFLQIVDKVVKKYKSLSQYYKKEDIVSIKETISKIKIILIGQADLDSWMFLSSIVDQYFEVTKVTDNSLIASSTEKIIKKIDTLIVPTGKEKENIQTFLSEYSKVAREKLNMVNFIGFDLHKYRQKPTEITLTDLFVKPDFVLKKTDEYFFDKRRVHSRRIYKIPDVFSSKRNIVILGDPGAGKSLLVKYIIVQLLNNKALENGLRIFDKHIPIRVELRKYSEHVEKKNILQYISDLLVKEYQISDSIIRDVSLDSILKNYPTLIFFDGLDEIFNISLKQNVKESIELFSIKYPLCKCVVTSRFIGYHDVKFNENNFEEFSISRFSEEHITELINKFIKSQIVSEPKRKERTNECITQLSEVDDELKSNPLILTLILILATNNLIIPDSKLEVYESCTNTLVDGIDDRAKGLTFTLPIENKRRTLGNLAYWQYKQLSSNDIITYGKSKKNIADYLIEKGEYSDFEKAEEAARVFLDYAERRSIYFDNSFTHKTFLEYYTADFIFIKYHMSLDIKNRDKIISEYIHNPFWNIVFELLIAKIDKDQEGVKVLDELILKQFQKPHNNTLSFFCKHLIRIKNISNEIRIRIIKETIYAVLKSDVKNRKRNGSAIDGVMSYLHQIGRDAKHMPLLLKVLNDIESELIEDESKVVFYIFFLELKKMSYEIDLDINVIDKQHMLKLAHTNITLFMLYYLDKDKSKDIFEAIKIQVEYFGINSIFKEIPFLFNKKIKIATYYIFLMRKIDKGNVEEFTNEIEYLRTKDVSFDLLEETTKSYRGLFFSERESILKTLRMFMQSSNEHVDEVLKSIIKEDSRLPSLYEIVKNEFNDKSKLKIILELIKSNKN